jgi:hypothetical protein
LRVKLNIQDELHKKRLLDALSLTDEYADLSGIVTSIHNDNQKAVINSNQKFASMRIQTLKPLVSFCSNGEYWQLVMPFPVT